MPELFEIDSDGWKAQQQGREPWELIREVLQNALDTESNVVVTIDTRKRKVIVEDQGGGFEQLSDAYTIFGGDKGGNPEKRGRFGRGLKETVGGAERVVVMTPQGTVEFNVRENERIEHDRTFSSGTKVVVENSDWSKEQLDDVKDYMFKIWPPEDQRITVDLKGGKRVRRERWKPDVVTSQRLKTVVVNNGVMEKEYRQTNVHIRKADKGHGNNGRVYEMGIPVSLDESFPFYVDVQQKIPMAEQRNEPDSAYLKKLKPVVLNAMHNEMDSNQLRANWVQNALESAHVSNAARETFVNEVLVDDEKAGTVVRSHDKADDKVKNYGYQVVDTSKLSSGAKRAANRVLQSAESLARELHERNELAVDPTPEQKEFIAYAEGIAEELGYEDASFETWKIEPSFEGKMPTADTNAETGRIRLNVVAEDWEEVNADTLGTVVHELSHIGTDGHGKDWYETMEGNFAELLVNRGESL